jgi:hypothetical protein
VLFLVQYEVSWDNPVHTSGVAAFVALCVLSSCFSLLPYTFLPLFLRNSILILATSISYFRRAFYQVRPRFSLFRRRFSFSELVDLPPQQLFLVCHIGGMIAFLVALNFHVPEFARPYTIVSLSLYGVDVRFLPFLRIGFADR